MPVSTLTALSLFTDTGCETGKQEGQVNKNGKQEKVMWLYKEVRAWVTAVFGTHSRTECQGRGRSVWAGGGGMGVCLMLEGAGAQAISC